MLIQKTAKEKGTKIPNVFVKEKPKNRQFSIFAEFIV